MRIRTLFAENHPIVMEGLCRVFDRNEYELVGRAADGHAAVRAAAALKPDIIILETALPLLNGIEAALRIRQQNAAIKLIFLTTQDDAPSVRRAFRAGGNGYVLKSSDASELLVAAREVMAGRRYISPVITLAGERALAEIGSSHGFGNTLSMRQREVLQLVAEGKTAKEAAEILHISVKTVDFHKTNLMDILGVRSSVDLARYAIQHGVTRQ
ncbi:MAG TPA: response regulator transcription factor [Bryobacteraceae bacterium]|nr:response regulator transcription factor [Bryobacteraceae bacterium]